MPEVHDSPNAWVEEHIRRFEETGGRQRPGVNDLLLTTRGRKTGEPRRTALVYGRDGGPGGLVRIDGDDDLARGHVTGVGEDTGSSKSVGG
jgi:hypothetical protein